MAHPCELLLGEIWQIISGKLGPQDLYNLAHAHPYWYTMLERKRTTFTMQLCMPLIPGLQLRDLLNLRLVDKASKHAVDHYLQHQVYEKKPFINEKEHTRTDFSIRPWVGIRFMPRKREILTVDPKFEDAHPRRIGAWLDSIDLTSFPSANPILSRDAVFYVESSEWSEEFQQETVNVVTRCLQAFGRHLRRCTFEMSLEIDGRRSFEREYSHLRAWLNLVPNLNCLKVNSYRWTGNHNETELAGHINDNPLPEIPHLCELSAKCLPPPLLHALMRKYNRVQTLELEVRPGGEDSLDPMHMENLNALKVILHQRHALVCFQQLLTESWLAKLNTLEVAMINGRAPPQQIVTWGILIAFLNTNFGGAERLNGIGLEMPCFFPDNPERCNEILRDSQTYRLRIPRVEKLKLVAHNFFLLDFLLPMRSTLKKLAVEIGDCGYYPRNIASIECRELIKWNGWLGSPLLDSNIWEALPQLNFMQVHSTLDYWAYRKRLGVPILLHPNGRELSCKTKENVDWEEKANGDVDVDAENLRP